MLSHAAESDVEGTVLTAAIAVGGHERACLFHWSIL